MKMGSAGPLPQGDPFWEGGEGREMDVITIRSTRKVTLASSKHRVPGLVLDGRPAVCTYKEKLQAATPALVHGGTGPDNDRGSKGV